MVLTEKAEECGTPKLQCRSSYLKELSIPEIADDRFEKTTLLVLVTVVDAKRRAEYRTRSVLML
jgi:hypothetical protein